MTRHSRLHLGTVPAGIWPTTSRIPLWLSDEARDRQTYVVGQTGTGKSTLLLNMIAQDLKAGRGIGVIDPHGTLALSALQHIEPHRHNQVIYIDPTDPYAKGFNPLEGASEHTAPALAEHILAAFLYVFDDMSIGPSSKDVLRNTLRALMSTPGTTLLGCLRMIEDPIYRRRIAARVTDNVIARYWHVTVPEYSPKAWEETTRPILNKLRAVLSDPRCRNMLCQPRSTFSLRRVMDEGHILLANLSIGALGEGVSHLIGALLTSAITTTAFQRIDHASLLTPDDLRRWYLYIDEFQMFSNSGFSRILSQTRKFRLLLTASHQYQGQLPAELNDAVLGNVGTTIVFRVGVNDADHLARHLLLDHHYHDADLKGAHQLLSLPNYQAYIKTLTDGAPALHHLMPYPEPRPLTTRTDRIISNSRALFGRPPSSVQRSIDHAYPSSRPSLIKPPIKRRSLDRDGLEG